MSKEDMSHKEATCIVCGKAAEPDTGWCDDCMELSLSAGRAIMLAKTPEDAMAAWGAIQTRPKSAAVGSTNCDKCGAILYLPYPIGVEARVCPSCAKGKRLIKATDGYDPGFWRMSLTTFRKLDYYRKAKGLGTWAEMMAQIADILCPPAK